MSKKIIVYIVISLSILIVFSFIALIYGMYLKISNNLNNKNGEAQNISLNLNNSEGIINIEVIDKNRLLIEIQKNNSHKWAIYNIDKNKIIKFIEK